jgi:Pyruvate/2-oxoacid:ferredoxin oxidoreductase delta subunit
MAKSSRFEKKAIAIMRKHPDKTVIPDENSVVEGFEYLASDEYYAKPDAVTMRERFKNLLFGNGIKNFLLNTKTMLKILPGITTGQDRNYLHSQTYRNALEENNAYPSMNPKLRANYPNIEIWEKLKKFSWENFKVSIGFTEVQPSLVFKGKAAPFKYALVCIQEMELSAILKAPEMYAGREVMRVYNSLGYASNEIAEYLQKEFDIHAQADHPLGGLVDFVPLAEQAGLGRMGRSGLLITPEYGTRHRISPIFIQEKIFPFTESQEHLWIDDFCKQCGNCERKCPTKAIFPEPKLTEKNLYPGKERAVTYDREKCYISFSRSFGCGVCIKVCPFVRGGYRKIKTAFERKQMAG